MDRTVVFQLSSKLFTPTLLRVLFPSLPPLCLSVQYYQCLYKALYLRGTSQLFWGLQATAASVPAPTSELSCWGKAFQEVSPTALSGLSLLFYGLCLAKLSILRFSQARFSLGESLKSKIKGLTSPSAFVSGALGLLQRRGVPVQHLGVNCFDHVGDTVLLILCFVTGSWEVCILHLFSVSAVPVISVTSVPLSGIPAHSLLPVGISLTLLGKESSFPQNAWDSKRKGTFPFVVKWQGCLSWGFWRACLSVLLELWNRQR